MTREDNAAADWCARALRDLAEARAEEDRHWRRLQAGQPTGVTSPLDNAYMDAVDRADQVQLEVLEAERAVRREQAI